MHTADTKKYWPGWKNSQEEIRRQNCLLTFDPAWIPAIREVISVFLSLALCGGGISEMVPFGGVEYHHVPGLE